MHTCETTYLGGAASLYTHVHPRHEVLVVCTSRGNLDVLEAAKETHCADVVAGKYIRQYILYKAYMWIIKMCLTDAVMQSADSS